MESYIRTPHSKRFVVEDSITKVTSDGKPHEMMTLIAVFSGLLAAIFILAILISLIGCKKKRSAQNCKTCASSKSSNESIAKLSCSTQYFRNLSSCSNESARSSISTNYSRTTSVPDSTDNGLHTRLDGIATICNGNLNGNLNSAFVGSELTLNDSLHKKNKKRTHWSDEINYSDAVKETKIDIERY